MITQRLIDRQHGRNTVSIRVLRLEQPASPSQVSPRHSRYQFISINM